MRIKASDIAISTITALVVAVLACLLYNLDWRWILGLTFVFDPVICFS